MTRSFGKVVKGLLHKVCQLCGLDPEDRELEERVMRERRTVLAETVASAHRLKRASEGALEELAKHTSCGRR